LASGLRAYVERIRRDGNKDEKRGAIDNILWIGWPGLSVNVEDEKKLNEETLKRFGIQSVFLSEELMEKFYQGFCNKTIWPLFHYFPGITVYEKEFWDQYISVNDIYCKA